MEVISMGIDLLCDLSIFFFQVVSPPFLPRTDLAEMIMGMFIVFIRQLRERERELGSI